MQLLRLMTICLKSPLLVRLNCPVPRNNNVTVTHLAVGAVISAAMYTPARFFPPPYCDIALAMSFVAGIFVGYQLGKFADVLHMSQPEMACALRRYGIVPVRTSQYHVVSLECNAAGGGRVPYTPSSAGNVGCHLITVCIRTCAQLHNWHALHKAPTT
jgi:hypothetical protein